VTSETQTQDHVGRVILEDAVRLPDSMLWRLQRAFYDSQGISAWVPNGVPHYVTTNPSIARAYARSVFGFLRDLWTAPRRPKQPAAAAPVIIELGAGSGQFAYHFLRAIDALHRASPFADREFTYVMTDFTAVNIEAWTQHSSLRPFIDSGRLDVAVFDAASPGPIELSNAGRLLGGPEDTARPIVVIANYVFDSLPQDLLSTSATGLHEHRLTVTSSHEENDLAADGVLDRLEMEWSPVPFDDTRYVDDADVTALVDWYAQNLYESTFLLPVAGVHCLDHFRCLTGGPLFALIGDRGSDRLVDLRDEQGPQIGLHGGCFSLPVNFHALGVWADIHGGEALTTRRGHTALNVNGFVCSMAGQSTAELRLAFTTAIEEAGPDDFYAMQQIAGRGFAEMSLDEMLAVIRWSAYDPILFSAALPHLITLVEGSPDSEFGDVRSMLFKVWDAHYPLPGGLDVAFSIATVLYGMGFYLDSLDFLHRSLDLAGPDSATYFNIGMSHYHLRCAGDGARSDRVVAGLSPGAQHGGHDRW
jgi:hypothetical protein